MKFQISNTSSHFYDFRCKSASEQSGMNCTNDDFNQLPFEFRSYNEEVTSTSEYNTIHPIDRYRDFITDETTILMVREVGRKVEYHQWKPSVDKEILQFFRSLTGNGIVTDVKTQSLLTVQRVAPDGDHSMSFAK